MHSGWVHFRPLALLTALAVSAMVGCAQRAGVLFPPVANAPSWPAPPDAPRVRYLGQLSTAVDLNAGKNFGQAFGDAVFGAKPEPGLLTPYAVCSDGGNRLFVADSTGQVVHEVDLTRRRWTRIAPDNAAKRFGSAVGIAYDTSGDGRLFVADAADKRVYVFAAGGKTPAGSFGGEFFVRPCGLAYDAARQRLLVVDAGAHQLLALTPDGRLIGRVGARGVGPGEFNYPTNVAVDSVGRVYVSDSLNFRVQQFDADLRPLRVIGRKGDMPGYFSQPKGVAVDVDDHLYVVDANFESVQIFDAAGRLLLHFGEEGRDPGEFWLPAGVYVDRVTNRIWVADSYNRRVQVFEYVPDAAVVASPEPPPPQDAPTTQEAPR